MSWREEGISAVRRSRELAGSAGVGASPGGYSDGGARTERLAWPGARPRQPVGLLKGGIVRQWRRDGIPIDDEDLGDLASCDGEALCEFEGVRFRFTAESIAGHPVEPAPRHGNAVVLTLRQIGGRGSRAASIWSSSPRPAPWPRQAAKNGSAGSLPTPSRSPTARLVATSARSSSTRPRTSSPAVRPPDGRPPRAPRRARAGGPRRPTGQAAHRLLAGLVDVEQAIEAADPKDAHDALVGARQSDGAGAPAPSGADRHGQPRGVDERDFAEVDDDRPGALLEALRNGLVEPRRGVSIDLAAQHDHRDMLRGVHEPHPEAEPRRSQPSDRWQLATRDRDV